MYFCLVPGQGPLGVLADVCLAPGQAPLGVEVEFCLAPGQAPLVWKWNFAWPLASKLNAKKAITGLTIVDVISCVNMFYELIS